MNTPTTNTELAAQVLATNLDRNEVWCLQDRLKQLQEVLSKSWAKDLTLSELVEAINMANQMHRQKEAKEKEASN
jgi:hypothetical protein